jgi:hypothetical protein
MLTGKKKTNKKHCGMVLTGPVVKSWLTDGFVTGSRQFHQHFGGLQ